MQFANCILYENMYNLGPSDMTSDFEMIRTAKMPPPLLRVECVISWLMGRVCVCVCQISDKSDYGEYVCVASNKRGSDVGHVQLNGHLSSLTTTPCSKKGDTKLTAITLLILNRFSNFFSLSDSPVNLQQSVYDPTAPHMRRYTTS